jgi:adenylosuccinate lyase
MITRYTRPEMAKIWSDEHRFEAMLEVEILAAEAMVSLKNVPRSAVAEVRKKARIDVARIAEIEKVVKHDVIAFLSQVVETVGPSARFLHLGMTSSDVLDTAFAVQITESCDLLHKGVVTLMGTLKGLALKYKDTPTMGRTHGVHAEPTTFGYKALGWYSEMQRAKVLLEQTKKWVAFGKISGAVGTYAHLSPKVEAYVCKKLKLQVEPVSTQIIPRDRHANFLCKLAIIGASLERIATEIRHLQRTEVLEAEEPFTEGQKGSSAMPHKRNPIMSENVCGLARLLRGFAATGMENVALWHERDISHSAAERVIFPDACIALDFMLARMNYVLSGLRVYPENMMNNLSRSQDTIFSGALLLALVDKGLTREQSYALMQKAAFAARESKKPLETVVLSSQDIRQHLTAAEIKERFDIKTQYKNINEVFRRVLKPR